MAVARKVLQVGRREPCNECRMEGKPQHACDTIWVRMPEYRQPSTAPLMQGDEPEHPG